MKKELDDAEPTKTHELSETSELFLEIIKKLEKFEPHEQRRVIESLRVYFA